MKQPRRLGLIIPWALFALIALGWTAYWNMLAHRARAYLEEAFAAERARGAHMTIGETSLRGFPLQCAFELRDVSYAPAGGAFAAMTQRVIVHVNVLNAQHVIVAFPAPLAFTRRDGRATSISGQGALLSVHTAAGALARASFEADALALSDPAKPAEATRFGRTLLHLRPDPRTPGAYQLAAQFEHIVLPRPAASLEGLGQEIAALDIAMVIEQGAALFNAPRGDALGAWAATGAQARLEGFGISWGAAQGAGHGAVRIDAERRLAGALSFKLEQPAQAFAALARSPALSRDARQGLQTAALAASFSQGALEIPLTAADGWLRVGPARVKELKPLYRPASGPVFD
ncbi:MAG: DUF2125 domain-containing protein [Hyphomonadaceae bacterium]